MSCEHDISFLIPCFEDQNNEIVALCLKNLMSENQFGPTLSSLKLLFF